MTLRARLRNNEGALLLDGGLATQLEAQGAKLQGDPLWSARLLHSDPQAISDAHHSFLLSGADVITTATYQATIPGFVRHLEVSSDAARELLASGLHLAKQTVAAYASQAALRGRACPLVAVSVGPYGASLHDGSEYTGAYAQTMSVEELKSWHRPQLECLAAAGADLLALETIPSVKEAQALVELLRETPDCQAWLSFSCKDGARVADGSPFGDGVRVAGRSTQVLAVGVNCCPPEWAEPLLASAATLKSPDVSWVVYPNSGEEWDSERGWRASSVKTSIPALSHTWTKQGVALIGGCCRVGPHQIAELGTHLKAAHP
ncbi:homocysteine S-methyltransferase YbgG isoform X1 [Nerophis lumbriciformis]|uniref:homocysteine S-methyltransferase YbgG isoform X1 n=1 Tax=Nerophis lumbriciformis TaxID=546530 RepID=UPI003BADB428